MFQDTDNLKEYVRENYPEVTDQRVDESHWDLQCPTCKVTRGFQFIKRSISEKYSSQYNHYARDFDAPLTYVFRCPVCKCFKQWIVFELQFPDESGKQRTHYFRVTSLPSEGLEDIAELPDNPTSLRAAYRQAIRAMDANAHLAAAAMFRRALQVITRDLLGARPGNLGVELKEVVGKSYNGGIITNNFANIGYIIKEVGNQGAHPDKDTDLLDFTAEDAEDLQRIFMELVSELFIIPAAETESKH